MNKNGNAIPVSLVVGGTSGLGLQIALKLAEHGNRVFITGRTNPNRENLNFVSLDITSDGERLASDLGWVIGYIGQIDLLVYTAGFYESGTIGELSDADIAKQTNVGLNAPAMLLQRILRAQGLLPGFIAITSTSQWIPRQREPIYCATKTGLAMLANCVSLDPHVGKVLVVGPAGMNTEFWEGTSRADLDKLLDPQWVAKVTLEQYEDDFKYRLVRILRDPPRVEILETRLE